MGDTYEDDRRYALWLEQHERAAIALAWGLAAVARLIMPTTFYRAPARVHRTTQQVACW